MGAERHGNAVEALIKRAELLASAMSVTGEHGSPSTMDVLDWLASAGLTLADDLQTASSAYLAVAAGPAT